MLLPSLLLQKPSKESKAKEHFEKLKERLNLWYEGKIEKLLSEGRTIQRRLLSSKRRSDTDVSKIFTKLMLQGKVNAAIKYLSENNDCGVLTINNEVVDKLREKHPTPGDIAENSLLNGPLPQTPTSYFDNINESTIRTAASLTKGAAGSSKLDAEQFKIMLVSNKFRKEGQDLRENIAIMAKKLATQIVYPATLEAYTACNLIPLDKGGEKLDVRPIGVREVLHRIIGKVISWTLKEDIQLAAGPLQTATGLESGAEAAIHAMK